ncbi:disease resistance protein TAO1-like [Cryptomeria japonica]|uniref:disease resistance protein TAO1-like n=1 Tax=Cryptomeria japonica TaxID=3369 RepID=UPI0027DAB483|nr:disease resistance protein TAO1-like [Cryptomeria japonica]
MEDKDERVWKDASDMAKKLEKWDRVEIKEYLGNKHETSIKVLNAIGNVHWVAVGFLMVGAALEIAETIKNNEEFEIDDKIKEVIRQLDCESDSATTAVTVYSIGGSGKTTLADVVYSSLKDKLQGWKFSKITLIKNLEKNPKVEELRSLILQDLTTTKPDVRDFQSGQQLLKQIIEKETIFLYIDNILYLEPLKNLLPKDFTSAKKLRLLLIAREKHVSRTIECSGIDPCKLYDIGCLSTASLQVLCKKIDRKKEKEFILQERPQLRQIAKICSCCPLFLEVIGAYLHQRKNKAEFYEQVLDSLEFGDVFSGSENYNFDDSRVLFSYDGLNLSAKEAFLDVCLFFTYLNWEEVACIVGDEEMECLKEGALIKRENEKINIHDLILAAGRNKSKWSRFKNEEEFSIALKNEELISKVKGVWIQNMKSPLLISGEELDATSKSLRVFCLGDRNLIIFKGKCNKQFDQLSWICIDAILMEFRSRDLTELPESLVRLRSLQKLDLSRCCNLKHLPAGFGELATLTQLDLGSCESLQELPRDLEKLTSLQSLNIAFCSSLLYLPESLGGLMSVSGWKIDFFSCSSLSELPEEICKNKKVTRISLSFCRSLKTLPRWFGELTCLQELNLYGCESLEQLCNDFHCLGRLRSLRLNKCKSLSSLPLGFENLSSLKDLWLNNCRSLSSLPLAFGKLTSLETLDLSACNKLEELCSNFHCLVALKYLNLSKCESLCNLPNRFGELDSLQSLNLHGCSHLMKLSDDFHLLQSLTRLGLSKCESLGGEWMDSVGNIRSLWSLDIEGNEKMIQRWMETRSQKERNLVVLQGEGNQRALLLEGLLSKGFDKGGLLVDADEHPFCLSSLQPQTPVILIIDSQIDSLKWGALGKNLQQLQRNSKELRIIYVGNRFKSLKSELATFRFLAYTPDNSRTSSFFHKLSDFFFNCRIAVFRSTDDLEEDGLKCLSAWEDISSYISNRAAFLAKTPRESNIELLNELLVTEKTDYLLLSENRQVKVATLQGKLILLLVTYLHKDLEGFVSAVKEMYLKMKESHNYVFEVVWVPIISSETTWEKFERAAASAPWPVMQGR